MKKDKRKYIALAIVVITVLSVFISSKLRNEGKITVKDDVYILQEEETVEDSLNKAVDEGKPSVIAVMSNNCIYCKQMQPILEEVGKDYIDDINIKILNIDNEFEKVTAIPVKATPAMLLVDSKGEPYEPAEKFNDLVFLMQDPSGNLPDLSMMFGAVPKETLIDLLNDIKTK